MYLMSGYRKRKFAQRSELSGPDGEPLQVDEVKRAGVWPSSWVWPAHARMSKT